MSVSLRNIKTLPEIPRRCLARPYSQASRQYYGPTLPANVGIVAVPQQEAWIVERFGKLHRLLEPGLAFLIPIVDRIAYVQSLKETAHEIPSQIAITADNVSLAIDGILYTKIVDPERASYGVDRVHFATAQLAQTLMRAEIGKLTLDRTLSDRQSLNVNITQAINEAARDWGIVCLRYEIKDIQPPAKVVESMHSQVAAERSKRAQILEAEGSKQAAILYSEGKQAEVVNAARADAEATTLRATATATALTHIAQAMGSPRGESAAQLQVAREYVAAFSGIAKQSSTVIIPSNVGDASGMVAQAMAIWKASSSSGTTNQPSTENVSTAPADADRSEGELNRDFAKLAASYKPSS